MPVEKVYLGLPAYNERDSIQPLFEKINELAKSFAPQLEVLVYDDGCTDGTKEAVQKWMGGPLAVTYLDGVVNKGLGTGVNSLLSHFVANASENDVLVLMDCDDTHDPQQIPEMLSVLKKSPKTNLIVASRYRRGGFIKGVPYHRILMSVGAAALYKMVHPIWGVRDYTCGYRLYTYPLLKKAIPDPSKSLLKERGFACMVELLLRLKSVGLCAKEIPMRLSYDAKRSASKMDVSGNAFRLLKQLLNWRVRGFQQ